MADHSPASITIGGAISRALLPTFLAAIDADGVCVDYGERRIEEADIVSGRPFYGAASSARSGAFDETEAFCRTHGLRYIRRSDACAGVWDPSIEVYPGSGDARHFDATSDGAVVITLADFHRLGSLAAIEAHFAGGAVATGPFLIVQTDAAGSPGD